MLLPAHHDLRSTGSRSVKGCPMTGCPLEPNFYPAWELNLIDSVWLDKYLLAVLVNYRK